MKKILGLLLFLILFGGAMTLLLGKLVLSPVVSAAVSVQDTWARPGAAGDNSAIYFTLDNRTPSEMKLTGVTCPAVEMAQIHQTTMDGNTASMKPVEGGVVVGAGAQVAFKPGGLHLMLMNLRQPFAAGQSVDCTLSFDNASPVTIKAEVRAQ